MDSNNETFSVVSYDLTTVDKYKNFVDIESKIQSIKSEVAAKYTEYLAIIKQFKGGDIVGFTVFLKLDTNTPLFDSLGLIEIEAIASSVENKMNSYLGGVSGVNVAEWEGLKVFNQYMKDIQGGTFDISYEAFYLKIKKECVPLFEIIIC